jgi:hypothetical protein
MSPGQEIQLSPRLPGRCVSSSFEEIATQLITGVAARPFDLFSNLSRSYGGARDALSARKHHSQLRDLEG